MSYNYYYQNCPNTQSDSDSTLSELTMKSNNRRTWKCDFIDLPCLKYISSTGSSFQNVKYVSLESRRIYKWVLMWYRYTRPSKCESALFFSECFEEINLAYASLMFLWYNRGLVFPVRYPVIGSDLIYYIHSFWRYRCLFCSKHCLLLYLWF